MPVGAAVVLLEGRELRRRSTARVALVHASALTASSFLSYSYILLQIIQILFIAKSCFLSKSLSWTLQLAGLILALHPCSSVGCHHLALSGDYLAFQNQISSTLGSRMMAVP